MPNRKLKIKTFLQKARIPRGLHIGLAAILVVAGASLVVPHVSQSFTDTSQTPPQGNVEAPINIGTDPQWKTGALGIGTSNEPKSKLEVNGETNLRGDVFVETGNDIYADDMWVGEKGNWLTNLLVADKSCSSGEAIVGIDNRNPQCGTVDADSGNSGGGGGSTPSLSEVLNEDNKSGGTQIDMEDTRIVSVANPQDPQDAATKSYVDRVSADWSSLLIFRAYADGSNSDKVTVDISNSNINFNTSVTPPNIGKKTVSGPNGDFKVATSSSNSGTRVTTILSAEAFAFCTLSSNSSSFIRAEPSGGTQGFDETWVLSQRSNAGRFMCVPYAN